MPDHWMTAEGEVHRAERPLFVDDSITMLRMQVEQLREGGWDWHVWDQAGRGRQRHGLADSLTEGKAKAEDARDALAEELHRLG